MPHQKRRSLRVRMITLVLIPSTALLVLWAALTALLVDDIRELRATATITEQIGAPLVETIGALQHERRATMDAARGTQSTAIHLKYARQQTNAATETLTESLRSFDGDDLPEQVLDFHEALDGLGSHRAGVDSILPSEITLEDNATAYTEIIELGLRVWDAQVERADPQQVPHLRSLTSLMRTRELLNQQDAVLAHAVATHTFPAQAHARFAAAAGAHHYTWDRVGAELSEEDGQEYIHLESYSALQRIYQLQESIISTPVRGTSTVPVNATAWQGAAEAVDARMSSVEQGQIDQVIAFSHTQSTELRTHVLLISVPTLMVALASTAIAVGGTQKLGRRLQELRTSTLEHARLRLPAVTARLRAGEPVDLETEAPRLKVEHTDEIAQVAQAFNDAQRAAVAAAVEEAQVRAGVRNMFRNIARRTQTLVHRQLRLLDTLERTETDPKVLEALFRIDHFSTQMRRNAENLMLLSGDPPPRQGVEPIRLHEMVRAAASEIEDYTRVQVLALPQVALRADVGTETVRLLAELLENATSFSPPDTQVTVEGRTSPEGGCVLHVHDQGLGMTADQRQAANALLADPPRFDLATMREDSQLGLFVVATIAERHGLHVGLHAQGPGGTLAVVTVPAHALAPRQEPAHTAREDTGPHHPLDLTGTPPMSAGEHLLDGATPTGRPPTPPLEPEHEDRETYMGLPRRRRRTRPVPSPAVEELPATEQRPLSQIQSMMSAFQAGTLRARAQSPRTDPTGADDTRPEQKR